METNDSPANTPSYLAISIRAAGCLGFDQRLHLVDLGDESGDFIFNGIGVRLNETVAILGELLIIYTSPVCVLVRSTALVPDSAFALVVCSGSWSWKARARNKWYWTTTRRGSCRGYTP